MFGSKKDEINLEIPILTIDHYPEKDYEIIGIITARLLDPKILKQADLNKIIPEMMKSAKEAEADAVIGTRISMLNAADIYAYGTAIRFK